MTWEDREDTKPTSLELLFTYGGGGGGNLTYRVVELKTLILEVGVKKKKTWEQAQQELRGHVVSALRHGHILSLCMSNSVPPLKSKLCDEARFPAELLDSFQAQSVRGAMDMSGKWVEKVLKKTDEVLVVDENFNVLLVSKFLPEDVQKYLEEEVPLANCQPIVVTQNGTHLGTNGQKYSLQ